MEQIAIFNEAMRRAHGWVVDTVNKIKAIQQGAKMPPEKKLPFTELELTQFCGVTSDITAKVDGDNVEIEALKRQVDALKINFLDGKFTPRLAFSDCPCAVILELFPNLTRSPKLVPIIFIWTENLVVTEP